MNKILVLSSGGLDSTVLLYKAVQEVGRKNVLAIFAYYGQKHAKEKESFQWQVSHLGIDWDDVDLSTIYDFNKDSSALLKGSSKNIKHMSYADQLKETGGNPVTAYVPYRNGLFLSVAASIAYQMGCDTIYYGAHADDAAGNAYPDCTKAFIDAQAEAIKQGTAGKVQMQAPWWDLNKAQVVHEGLQLGMTQEEFEHTWSCYEGKDKPCGTCGTCIDRRTAFRRNGLFIV